MLTHREALYECKGCRRRLLGSELREKRTWTPGKQALYRETPCCDRRAMLLSGTSLDELPTSSVTAMELNVTGEPS